MKLKNILIVVRDIEKSRKVVLIHLYEYTGVAYNRPILYPVIRPFAEGIILMFLLLSGYTYHAGKSIKADFIKNFCNRCFFLEDDVEDHLQKVPIYLQLKNSMFDSFKI